MNCAVPGFGELEDDQPAQLPTGNPTTPADQGTNEQIRTTVESLGRRGSTRYSTRPLPSRLVVGAGRDRVSIPVTLNNIAIKGAQVRSPQSVALGTHVQLQVDGESAVTAIVVRVLPAGEEGFFLGLSLIDAWQEASFDRLAKSEESTENSTDNAAVDPVPAGCRQIPGFRIRKIIGVGGTGRVAEIIAPGGISKAAKFVKIDPQNPLSAHELESLHLIGSIQHPYLLTIDRFHVEDDTLIMVMELADHNLAEQNAMWKENGYPGIPETRLLALLREAAEVLDLLNDQYGIRHLDIKPENLFVIAGHLKVGDLGLARKGTSSEGDLGVRAISPCYAPPELFNGQSSSTSDQYSLAVVYMELLTGQRPFVGTTQRQLAMLHATTEPDVSALPTGQQEIVRRALSKNPAERFPSCSAFVEALRLATTTLELGKDIPPSLAGMQSIIEANHEQRIKTRWRREWVRRQLYVACGSALVAIVAMGLRESSRISKSSPHDSGVQLGTAISLETDDESTNHDDSAILKSLGIDDSLIDHAQGDPTINKDAPISIQVGPAFDPFGTEEHREFAIEIENKGAASVRDIALAVEIPEGSEIVTTSGTLPASIVDGKLSLGPIALMEPGERLNCRVLVRDNQKSDKPLIVRLVNSSTRRAPSSISQLTRR